MKFVLMGLKMARRSFTRSVLAVLSIAFATVTLIAAGHLAMGRPGQAAMTARAFIGGDIMVFPDSMAVADASLHPNPGWHWRRADYDNEHLLIELMPSAVSTGLMIDTRHRIDDLLEAGAAVQDLEGVTDVYPVYTMPVFLRLHDELVPTILRSRVVEQDIRLGLGVYVVSGRYLSEKGEAVLENWRPETEYEGRRQFGYDRFDGQRIYLSMGQPVISQIMPPVPGEQLHLEIPRFDGHWNLTETEEADLSVVGLVELPTRSVQWSHTVIDWVGLMRTAAERDRPPSKYVSEHRYWTTPQVQVTHETFEQLAQEAGWEPEPSLLAVSVQSQAMVNALVEEIRRDLGSGTVLAVADWFDNHLMAPEPLMMFPPSDVLRLRQSEPRFTSASFAPPRVVVALITWAAYIMGAMLYAGTVYVIFMKRRTELALMKVLGARNRQVVTAVLTEMVTLGIAGALIGLVVMAPFVLWQLGTAAPSTAELVRMVAELGGHVLAVAVLVCALFGAVPAYLLVSRAAEESLTGGGG